MSTVMKRWASNFKDETVRELAEEIALQDGVCFEVEKLLMVLDSKLSRPAESAPNLKIEG